MRSWLAARWRISAVVVAVVLGMVATTVVTLAIKNAGNESAADGFDCTQLEEVSFDEAGPKARACDVDVEVTSERTPWETTWATPDGTTRLEVSTMPTRTSASGEWKDIDTKIQGTPGEGVLVVAAPVYPIELNAGGEAGKGHPLGSITRDGKRLDVWFPTELPVPVIGDSQLIYELAEGVRLVVSVSGGGTGFLPVVELAAPKAAERFRALVDAARPAGFPGGSGDLVFSTAMSEGLRLVPEEQGSVLVVDEVDEVAFVASPPVMWDSAGGNPVLPESVTEVSNGDRTRSPAMGDKIELMSTAVDGTRIVVSPDRGMLAEPDTVWPVYIDPGFNAKRSTENVAIRTGGYTGTLYNWTTVGGEGAGYCTDVPTCNTTFKQRLVWEYSDLSTITALTSTDIVSAGFTVYGTHSAQCTATTTDLHMLGGISSSTTWGSLVWADYNRVSSRTEYHSVNCGNTGWRTYDAKWAIQQFADNDSWSTLSLGLKARDESTMTSWKRFGHDATLSVEYNRVPNKPSSLQVTNPSQPACSTSQQLINSKTPTLSAIVSDPDGGNVAPHFQVYTKSGATETEVWNSTTLAAQASGTRAQATVVTGKLVENTAYFWRVTSVDTGGRWSGWGVSCEFMVDVTLPVQPTVTPVASDSEVQAIYDPDVERGGVGMKGKFTLSPGSSTDVVKFSYSFGDPAAMTTVAVTQGASYVLPFDPVSSGSTTLYVKSIDRAGNVSPQQVYAFKVAAPVEDVIWRLDENTGSSAANSGPKTAGPLSITGAGWVAGPHQLFGSRANDWALSFDGVNDAAISGGPILDTSKSFTVSAHVLLNNSKLGQGNYTALSQDGLTQSAFQLGYRSNCDAYGTDCWSFSMPDASSGTTVMAATSSSVTAAQWVQLVGEHDATAKTMRLWVCEVGTPEQIATGEPVASAPVTRGGGAWKSPGAFAVGRGQAAAAGASWWPGRIDNVRLFSGQITDPSKLRRLCQGAEVEDFGQGTSAFNAVDPTVSEQ